MSGLVHVGKERNSNPGHHDIAAANLSLKLSFPVEAVFGWDKTWQTDRRGLTGGPIVLCWCRCRLPDLGWFGGGGGSQKSRRTRFGRSQHDSPASKFVTISWRWFFSFLTIETTWSRLNKPNAFLYKTIATFFTSKLQASEAMGLLDLQRGSCYEESLLS